MLLTAAACILLVAAIFYWVFTAPEPLAVGEAELRHQAARDALEERKAAIYANLKDLHFEHLAGKLSTEDYEHTRAMLEQEAAGVIAELGPQQLR
ncbi:MAG: hypothetical protein ACRD1E_02415 [Terriglobales bacterium]